MAIIGGVATHAYTSFKPAMLGLTRNTALELGQFGFRVNCVSPYAVPTPMSRKGYNLKDDDPFDVYSNLKGVALKPEDVAQSVLYLASKYVSGHNLIVDGGFTIVNTTLTMFG
ncbi:unnamed protein product [Ilex paraguariensis]|uniref:Uncharacterized protein n=1 Tax=Ilex paraguariensis TaxID=185542 RepID=A0ABC8S953_9AQUA